MMLSLLMNFLYTLIYFVSLNSKQVYDLVRTSLDATATGYFSSYRFNSPLSDKAIDALIQSGLQLRDIQSAGYPRAICDQFEFRVKRLLA